MPMRIHKRWRPSRGPCPSRTRQRRRCKSIRIYHQLLHLITLLPGGGTCEWCIVYRQTWPFHICVSRPPTHPVNRFSPLHSLCQELVHTAWEGRHDYFSEQELFLILEVFTPSSLDQGLSFLYLLFDFVAICYFGLIVRKVHCYFSLINTYMDCNSLNSKWIGF